MRPDVDDEVDEIVAAWRRERPDLDTEPLQVLSRISRLAAVLDERRTDAFAGHGLQGHEFDVLSVLRRSGEPDVLVVAVGVMAETCLAIADRLLTVDGGSLTLAAGDAGGLVATVQLPAARDRRPAPAS